MNYIEKIRQEIERRIKLYSITNEKEQWIVNTYWSVLSFIDSLPEEKPSEDLEEAAEKRARKIYPYEVGIKGLICENSIPIYKAGFTAGTEWQREQDAARRK